MIDPEKDPFHLLEKRVSDLITLSDKLSIENKALRRRRLLHLQLRLHGLRPPRRYYEEIGFTSDREAFATAGLQDTYRGGEMLLGEG